MVSMDDAAQFALALPGVTEGVRWGTRSWLVGGKVFAWERPFSKADLKRFGTVSPPEGAILAVSVEDLGEKEAILAAHPTSFFSIAHFNGYPAVLIHLNSASVTEVHEALVDAWLVCAPESLADDYLRGVQKSSP